MDNPTIIVLGAWFVLIVTLLILVWIVVRHDT
jgi:hypothetical protein